MARPKNLSLDELKARNLSKHQLIWCENAKNLSLGDRQTANLPKNLSLAPDRVRS